VPSGLFELRKDPITSWWVATIVDRQFHRDRFARAAEPVDDKLFGCGNCAVPGEGVRTRMLKDFAFHVVGTDTEARELESDHGLAQVSLAQARATGSWRTIIAPTGEHRPLHAVGSELIERLITCARDELAAAREDEQTEYLTVVQNWGAQAGARTNHLCLDLYDLPQIPHRIAEELGGAARFVIREGECPFCRLVRDESRRPDRLVWEDHDSVAFAPYASRSAFEVWIVPRRHDADLCIERPDLAVDGRDLTGQRVLSLLGPGDLRLDSLKARIDRLLAAGDVAAGGARRDGRQDQNEWKESPEAHRA
jgi:UDPglucose--hexose-1-phosphate uridylyltransferase